MVKAMIFIDGTWLFSNRHHLSNGETEEEIHIDYLELPKQVRKKVAEVLKLQEIDVVRIYLFGSIAKNFDPRDEESVRKRKEFFDMLEEEFHYDVKVFPVDFHGNRLSRYDREEENPFEPKEKCVDIALASTLLYYGSVPNAYDIAIAVLGDRDYVPAMEYARLMGKRVVLVSVKGSCAKELWDPQLSAELRDGEVIWLNDIKDDIRFSYEPVELECESPLHEGDRKVTTTFRPKKGQPFYCDDCRAKFAAKKESLEKEFSSMEENEEYESDGLSNDHLGTVYKLFSNDGYGFIRGMNGLEYFFHLTDLEDVEWAEIEMGMKVIYSIKREPSFDKAGAAYRVRKK